MDNVQIYGERCSGTNWLKELVDNNFVVNSGVWHDKYGWKHWFITNETFKKISEDKNTLFLVIFRNPYTWINSLHNNPHHLHDALNLSLDGFISKEPLTSYHGTLRNKGGVIEESKNVFKLRSEKITNFLKLKEYTDNVVFIKYEDLMSNPINFLEKFKNMGLITKKNSYQYEVKKPSLIELNNDIINKINNKLDWSLEDLIGYKKNMYE